MEIKGKIKQITEKIIVGQKQTEKQSIIVEEILGDYPNSLCIDVLGKSIEKLKGFKEGDHVVVEYKTTAKEYNGRVFNNISLRAIKSIAQVEAMEDS